MANVSDLFPGSAPLYRQRMAMRRQSDQAVLDEPHHVAQLFHHVFGTPEGGKALDYICLQLCRIDDAYVSADPMALVAANALRNVGLTIAKLALAPYHDSKPEVKA